MSRCSAAANRLARPCAQAAATDTSALPRVTVSAAEVEGGLPVVDLFIKLEFGKSKGEVRPSADPRPKTRALHAHVQRAR